MDHFLDEQQIEEQDLFDLIEEDFSIDFDDLAEGLPLDSSNDF